MSSLTHKNLSPFSTSSADDDPSTNAISLSQRRLHHTAKRRAEATTGSRSTKHRCRPRLHTTVTICKRFGAFGEYVRSKRFRAKPSLIVRN